MPMNLTGPDPVAAIADAVGAELADRPIAAQLAEVARRAYEAGREARALEARQQADRDRQQLELKTVRIVNLEVEIAKLTGAWIPGT